jgi:hypothetical protein
MIFRALRILRVADANTPPAIADFETGVLALNGMLRRWEANGIALGWMDVSAPQDTLPLPPEALTPVAFNLALELRPEYGCSLDSDVVKKAYDYLTDLQRDVAVATPMQPILDVPLSDPASATYFGFGDMYY